MPLAAVIKVLDGASTIGGTKIYLRMGQGGVFLDFGINFSRMSMFYEEYLKPRPGRGIHDYLAMGLVPPLRVYRDDLFPVDVDPNALSSINVSVVFLTHAHHDHSGYMGFLRNDIPVCCTAMTAALLKALQDSGRSDLPSQLAYATPRKRDEDERLLKTCDRRNMSDVGRDFFIMDSVPDGLVKFWRRTPVGRSLIPGRLESFDEAPFQVIHFPVDHSIFGATAYALETKSGWVVYTGDIRMHGARAKDTNCFVEAAADLHPKVLIIEGTRCSRAERHQESEEDVYRNCLGAVEGQEGLIVADFSPRNFERLETFMCIADKTGRHLAVTPKDAYVLDAVATVDGIDRMKRLRVFCPVKERQYGWEKEVWKKFREKMVDPRDISADPESYILCFSFWDIKNLLDIKPEGGLYIYSSSEAFNEEDTFDFCRLWNWLRMFGMDVIGFSMGREGEPVFTGGFHASGHASPSDLIEIVERISPKTVIPVHTENPWFFREHVRGPEVRILYNGDEFAVE